MENNGAEKSQIWKYVIEQQSIIDPILQMKMSLQNKYYFDFNFFLSKPINEIVYELTNRTVTQAFMDSRIESEQAEYLKRQYHLKNQQGHEQLYDRIKMLGKFYNQDDKYCKFDYPTMILTNTKSIFEKRHRRFKKISAGEGSSDETEEKSSFCYYSFDTDNFLKDMSSVSRIYNEQNNDENEESFDSDVHDVYLKESNPYVKLNFFDFGRHQSEVSHNIFKTSFDIDELICDFHDQQSTEHQEKKKSSFLERQSLKSIAINNSRKPLKSQDNKNSSLPKMCDDSIKDGQKQKKTNFLSSYLNLFQNKYRKIYLDGNHSTLANTDIKTTTDQNDNTENFGLKKIDQMIQKQKQDKMKHRRKIRQKAEELLRKVRISSQIQ